MIPWSFIISLVAVTLILWVAHRIILPPGKLLTRDRKLPRLLLMTALALAGLLIVIVFLPVSDELEAQILSIVGIAIPALIAVASTSVIENAISGLVLRLNQAFAVGDYIRVEEHSGRVTERGLFDTEIQTGERELLSLPNSYLLSTPVAVVPGERAVISANVCVGGSEDPATVEALLKQSALDAGLADPFVLIIALNADDVQYRASGFLTEDSRLIAKRSTLNRAILTNLAQAGIAVCEPAPVSIQQQPARDKPTKPAPVPAAASIEDHDIDDLVFEKATKAERIEQITLRIEELKAGLGDLEEAEAERLTARISRLEGLLEKTDAE